MQNFKSKKKVGFINAGIASYSPSLMNLQLDVLEQDFKIFPDVIIAYIDQTDIGDENCRYKNNKIYKNCLIHPYSELDNIQPLSIENVRIDSSDMTNTFDQANELGIPMSILSNTNNIPYINIPNKSYKNLSNNIKGDIIKSIQSQY